MCVYVLQSIFIVQRYFLTFCLFYLNETMLVTKEMAAFFCAIGKLVLNSFTENQMKTLQVKF